MDKLKELLPLLREYGVTSYADNEFKIELTLGVVEEPEEGEFEVDWSGLQMTGEADDVN
jgi:hypothetical protein